MESTLEIRKKIHEFIDYADERILKIFNAIITSEEVEEEGLTTAHKAILDERMKEHLEDPNAGKHWNDVKKSLKKEYGI
jgi:hypothetical protein